MGNWWLDESPYSGPASSDFLIEWTGIARRFGKTNEAITKIFADLAGQIGRTTEELVIMFSPLHIVPYSEIMTYEERREYALKYQQNRNTGPKSTRTFNRNGKRMF